MRTLLPLLFLIACTGASDEETDTDPVDTVDTDTSDTDDPVDTDTGDTSDTDTFEPDPDCADWYQWEDMVLQCGGEWTTLWKMSSLSHPYDGFCDSWYSDGGSGAWATPEEMYAALDCDTSCVYDAVGIADVLVCTYRGSYVYYDLGGIGQTGDGSTCDQELIFVTTCAVSGYYAGASSGDLWSSVYELVDTEEECATYADECPPR